MLAPGEIMATDIEPLDLLRKLGDEYRHLEEESRRLPPHGATRHRIGRERQAIAAHFERVLVEWVPGEELRARWREFMRGHAPAPDEPQLPSPPLFKGRSDAGTTVEILPVVDGYDVFGDGARIDHSAVPWHLDPQLHGRLEVAGQMFDETFDAPLDAVMELAAFLDGRASPPWRWARELIEDGLIDTELALTPRGRRCFDRLRATATPPPPHERNYCVLVADAARARVLVLDVDGTSVGPTISELVEVTKLAKPALRARDTEAVSDSGGGRRGGAKTPLHVTPDHRDHRRRDLERHFAALIAEEAAAVWRRYPSCELIVVASPVMLGLLRPEIARQIRAKDRLAIHELDRDLTRLTVPMLHDLLADQGFLPGRGRRPPLVPAPGLPI
ncbi:MAG TPA: host attachment protein [Kofleriaceae bacterium]